MTESDILVVDVLIVGAGWAGCWSLQALREAGITRVKIVDSGSEVGGAWNYTQYPGCRNDVPVPEYQFSAKATWEDWAWKHRYPFQQDVQDYFKHVCEKLDWRRDMVFEKTVTAAKWDSERQLWKVSEDGAAFATTKFLILCTGYVTKKILPNVMGLETFPQQHHTSQWPADLDVANKRVGVIGTGASGIQVIEDIAPRVQGLVVFQRTPNLATPRRHAHQEFSAETQKEEKEQYPAMLAKCGTTSSGQLTEWGQVNVSDAAQMRAFFEARWKEGNFWFGNDHRLLECPIINAKAYRFWREKVMSRVNDPSIRDILAPSTPPHPFGAKRPSHESAYFERFNQSNVRLVDVNTDPIVEVTARGIRTQSAFHPLEVLVLATGFEAIIGSILNIDIRGKGNISMNGKWADRIRTSLGLATAMFPNLFFPAGPQAPTAFGATPRLSEIQANWIARCIKHVGVHGVIEADEAAEEFWDQKCEKVTPRLLKDTRTWYMRPTRGGSGEQQAMCWYGGMVEYQKLLRACEENGYEGFTVTKPSSNGLYS